MYDRYFLADVLHEQREEMGWNERQYEEAGADGKDSEAVMKQDAEKKGDSNL